MASSVESLIGNTPIVDLTSLLQLGIKEQFKNVRFLAKCEFISPGMSLEDRIMLRAVEIATKSGLMSKSVPNLYTMKSVNDDRACSFAMVCAIKGFPCSVVSTEGANQAILRTVKAFGGCVCATAGKRFCIELVEKKATESVSKGELYDEIYKQIGTNLTHFVASDENKDLLPALATRLKETNPSLQVISTSVIKEGPVTYVSSNTKAGILKTTVTGKEVNIACHLLARSKGLLTGYLSGVNVSSAMKICQEALDHALAKGEKTPSILVCTILPDSGLKYLNTIYKQPVPREIVAGTILSRPQVKDVRKGVFSKNSLAGIECFDVTELIGETPLIDLSYLVNNIHGHSNIKLLAKLECFNPGFSIKDRITKHMIEVAENQGKLSKGSMIVAASSGNTGASTAMFSALKGYRCLVTTSPKCSAEKRAAIQAYGAELWVAPAGTKEGDSNHYMQKAQKLAEQNPTWFDMHQYSNMENPAAHYSALAPEILSETDGNISTFVCAGSTGGTFSGVSKLLKQQSQNIRCILADPIGSVFSQHFWKKAEITPGKFLVEGVGKGSIPGCMDLGLVDDVELISDEETFSMCHRLACEKGLLLGGSSGLNVAAALKLANRSNDPKEVIVTVLPDSGIKYLSKVYCSSWLKENSLESVSVVSKHKTEKEN